MPRGVLKIESTEAFDEAIGSGDVSVVLFGAPWCPACKDLKKPFLKMSKEAKGIRFLDVNVDALADVGDKWNIDSMPTVMLFSNGKPLPASHTKGKTQLVGPTPEEVRSAFEPFLPLTTDV